MNGLRNIKLHINTNVLKSPFMGLGCKSFCTCILIGVLCFVTICSTFTKVAFAYTNGVQKVKTTSYTSTPFTLTYPDDVTFWYLYTGSYTLNLIVSNSDDLFVAHYKSPTSSYPYQTVAVIASPTSQYFYSSTTNINDTSDIVFNRTYNTNNFSSDYNLYYNNSGISYTDSELFNSSYESLDEALTAIANYSDPQPSYTNYYSLLNGYAIVFDFGKSGVPYDIAVTQQQITESTGQFDYVNSTWGWSNTLPAPPMSFPRSSDLKIPFYKTGSDNLWGASDNGFSNKETMVANGFWNNMSNSRYLIIYNPYAVEYTSIGRTHAGTGSPLQYYYPKPINITITGAISYKLISLRSEATNTGVIGNYNSDTYTDVQDIESDGTLDPKIDGDTPNEGGQNTPQSDLDPIQSISGYLQSIAQTLNDFANSFISLLQAPISHVRQLIAAGTEYFQVIQGLYGWLPNEVQTTINSAMIVSISVGVIALLL